MKTIFTEFNSDVYSANYFNACNTVLLTLK